MRPDGVALPSGSPAFRVWLPSWRRQPLDPRKPVSAPHAHGLRSSRPFSEPAADPKFPKDLPLLRFPTRPIGLVQALQRLALAGSAAPSSSPTFFRSEWGPCPLELSRLPGFLPPDMGRSFFLLPAPLALCLPIPEETRKWSLRGSLPAARHLPSFEGHRPAWRSRPTASATL